jgi:hypothetical protein
MGVLESYEQAMKKAILEKQERLAELNAEITCEIELGSDSHIPWLKVALIDRSVEPPDIATDYWSEREIETIDMENESRDHVDELIEDLIEARTGV